MAEPDGEKPKPKGRIGKWLRRIGWAALILLAILVVFHRPIIFEGTRYFVVRAAKQQNLDISYEIDGSIFSTLTIKNLKGTPIESGPIQRLEIGTIDLKYSLWGALRNGLPALLDLVALKDVYIEITPSEQPPPEKQKEPQALKFPGLFPKTLDVENVNFVSRGKNGDTVLDGLWLTLLPDKPGVLRITTLDIPGVRKWTDIEGRTTYADRNLLLTNLRIGSEVAVERFNLDASELEDAILGIELEGTFFDAPVSLDVHIEDLNATNDLDAAMSVRGLEFQKIWDYLQLKVPFSGVLDVADVKFAGKPNEPVSWTGEVNVELSNLASDAQKIGDVKLSATMSEGQATLNLTDQFDAANQIALTANSNLPEKIAGFSKSNIDGSLLVNFSDLAIVVPDATGDLTGRIDFGLADNAARADGNLHSDELDVAGARVRGSDLKLSAEKSFDVKKDAPPFEKTSTDIVVTANSVQFQDYDANALVVSLATDGADVSLREISLKKEANQVRINGSYELPADMKSFGAQPWVADVNISAPALNEFVADGAGADLQGALSIAGSAKSDGKSIVGEFDIEGREIASSGLTIPSVDGKLNVADDVATLSELVVVFNEDNQVRASGEVQIKEPYLYSGQVHANLADLTIFDPVSPEAVAGSLEVNWEGRGDVENFEHSGNGNIILTNGQYGANAGLNAQIQAAYTPEMIDVPVLQAVAEMGGVTAKVHWENKQLAISELDAKLKELTVLSGSLSVPLDLDHLDNIDLLVPNDGEVAVNLTVPKLKLQDVFAQSGNDEPPVTGAASADITASGTIADLVAGVSLRAEDIEATGMEDSQPADVALDIALRDDRLAVDGKITDPRINPLVITGAMPVDVAEIKQTRKLPDDTPIDLSVKMADSSLAFVASMVPAIRYIEGTAGIDLNVTGTMSDPKLAGDLGASIKHLRLNNEGLPPITNTVIEIDSTTERLTVSQFRGEIAGGEFGAEGSVDFSNPEKPVFDLAFGTRNALVMQDEAITLRISSRIDIDGPLDSATVGGEVYVTRSRFYKDIDILPIGLPGRPAPEPPPAPQAPGIPDPPLRNWKFDIAIKTADPFLVQGNLANGRITMDLRVGGTGLKPWVDGGVRIEQLRTSLPFSTLEIDNGLVYFTKDHPFLPQFDIRGTSQIRDYDITAYIYGNMSDPQATFTSNPPLPQTEIVSLIATGVTSKELAGNPSVLAGKAASLLFQKIYRSVFKRNSSEPPRDTLISKIDFELGATDPKTGRQGVGIRFPLTDNVVLSSGVDVGGDFRGQVKYLIRFR